MKSLFNSKRLVPPALVPAAKIIYHGLFRFHLRIRIWRADRLSMPVLDIPVPPAALRFRVSESLSVREFLDIGENCATLIRQYVKELGIDLDGANRMLDFGCGCGRTIRWFLRRGGPEFHGVDVDAEAVAWCRSHLQPGHFLVSAPAPPLPYPAGHFDIVYCVSVFTHLNEAMQDIWLAELRRILKPGGVLLITIHGTAAARGLDPEDRAVFLEYGFVHKRSQKLKGFLPDWYQTSWHSQRYIEERLAAGFEDIRYHVIPGAAQDVVVARKAGA